MTLATLAAGRCAAHRRIMLLNSALGLAAAVSGACADGSHRDEIRVSTRDSSGVQIAQIQGDPWAAPTWATLDTGDVLRIAPDETRPETLFGRVRGVLRLSDGSIAVLDVGRHRVQRFAADGSLLRSIGRQGQGPGELDQPWRLIRAPADTVGVYDMAGHLEMFPSSGDGARRVRLPLGKRSRNRADSRLVRDRWLPRHHERVSRQGATRTESSLQHAARHDGGRKRRAVARPAPERL